jgi:hypothetical protein
MRIHFQREKETVEQRHTKVFKTTQGKRTNDRKKERQKERITERNKNSKKE